MEAAIRKAIDHNRATRPNTPNVGVSSATAMVPIDDKGIMLGTDTVIRDVHMFIDRVKDAAAYRGVEKVKARILSLLRGSAQQ
ncbi:hypothetical protein LTR91_005535 [Friedmanniomyces endolithicus]|uniref:Uncharacterized protein n=1 Tax=Friedmanniomyces endolithicus TaxID=329885 RepID=A0AAN6FS24_9PEZI|nr:hypothetical protein LTR35_008506 [Friedmanniomyces endolithicus]KAK0294743.1 hypothetical protein LTS00_006578 [Friedmanniomyces endolithicus]KAK0322442.1 hypothetical protein LTR82_006401 [Friedmanniomyces endolithicus]KAK0922042.1 hypothetical protein LTR57_008186 [Friedmanniomyces endolithicus]KAK1000964.1 hypothetical protein LTR91_005535 [Friedmanniomyces endolithicus]